MKQLNLRASLSRTAFFPSDPKGSLSVQQLYDNEMGASIKKKRRKKIEITKTNWPFPFPLFFFKYPQYLEEIFIWIYMKLFAHVCFFLVPPAALWQITTALLFFLNSPPLILYESSLEQPVFEGKTNRINIWTCSLNDLLDCHCCLDLSYTG